MFRRRQRRDPLINLCANFLEPGEQVAHLVRATKGPNRWLGLAISLVAGVGVAIVLGPLFGLMVTFTVFVWIYAKRIILATDQAVVILECRRFVFAPKSELVRLPVDTRIGPLKGLWLSTTLDGQRLYIQPRSVGEVTAADRELEDD